MIFWFDIPSPPSFVVYAQAQIREADAHKDDIMKKCASGDYEYLLIEVGKSKIRVECDKQAPKIRGDGSVVGQEKNEFAKPVEVDPNPPPKGCTKEEQLFGICNLTELRKLTRKKMTEATAKNPQPEKTEEKAEEVKIEKKEDCLTYAQIGLVKGQMYEVGGTTSELQAIVLKKNDLVLGFRVDRPAFIGPFGMSRMGDAISVNVIADQVKYSFPMIGGISITPDKIAKLCKDNKERSGEKHSTR